MLRPCLECGDTLTTGTRCDSCRRNKDRKRNAQRGDRYGATHRADRRQWSTHVDAGVVHCWRCGVLIRPGEAWDLGHRWGLPSHPEHASCNRSAGGRGVA
jgi:hypothetical protein